MCYTHTKKERQRQVEIDLEKLIKICSQWMPKSGLRSKFSNYWSSNLPIGFCIHHLHICHQKSGRFDKIHA